MRIDRDISFVPGAEMARMDIYYPETSAPDAGFPSVLVIHGGGWFVGDKSDKRQVQMSEVFASNGYMVFNINYTMHKEREHARDHDVLVNALNECRAALSWIRQRQDTFTLNNKIGCIGGSAGGNLSLMLATTAGHPELDSEDSDTSVQAVINLYAPVTRPEPLIPLSYLSDDCPPIITYHGTADTIVDVNEAYALDAALKKLGHEHPMTIIEGAPHTFNLISEWGDFGDEAVAFFDTYLR